MQRRSRRGSVIGAHRLVSLMNERVRELVQWSVSEIERLRKQNELQAAKLEGVEMMAMAVHAERPHGPGIPMQEDLLYRMKDLLLAEQQPESQG